MKNVIVVGYDGSPGATSAVEIAAVEAELHGASLTLLAGYLPPSAQPWVSPAADALGDDTMVRAAALRAAEAMRDSILSRHPALECRAEVVLGAARDALVEASRDADLVVVGKTGRDAAESSFLGSVANAVVRRSACPVLLVPRCATFRPPAGRVVVGVDGSPCATDALDWAVDEAALRRAELIVVHAYSFPHLDAPAAFSDGLRHELSQHGSAILAHALNVARERAPGLVVAGRLVEDRPSAALLEQAASADLVVVGTRGHGGLRSMMFGSVAHALTEGAVSSTVVVRHTRCGTERHD